VSLREFLSEAIFNIDEVSLWAIEDSTYKKDNVFRVFAREDVLDIFCKNMSVEVSNAGKYVKDFNVDGQKTLLRYLKNGKFKNIGEIEVRNDSEAKYRSIRFNMYSEDALRLLMAKENNLAEHQKGPNLIAYGRAIQMMQ